MIGGTIYFDENEVGTIGNRLIQCGRGITESKSSHQFRLSSNNLRHFVVILINDPFEGIQDRFEHIVHIKPATTEKYYTTTLTSPLIGDASPQRNAAAPLTLTIQPARPRACPDNGTPSTTNEIGKARACLSGISTIIYVSDHINSRCAGQ